MSNETVDVSKEYQMASNAAMLFNPGEQPDIIRLMRAAFMHGYAKALIDQKAQAENKVVGHE